MSFEDQQRAIRLLLDEQNPADGMAAYYAFHHGADKTTIMTAPADAGPGQAKGYVAVSRTGLDLFRPLLTMRLPIHDDLELSGTLLREAVPSGAEAFLACPLSYDNLVRAFYEVNHEEQLAVFAHTNRAAEPIINVLVTREDANGMPRFVIKREENGRRVTAASAALNWQSPNFAEIAVRTTSGFRRQGFGRSVVSALTQEILKSGRRPLYAVSPQNRASVELAQRLGFQDTGYRQLMLTVRRR